MSSIKGEKRNYGIDHKLKAKSDDPLFHVHEYGVDLKSNHIYLFGVEDYINPEGFEPGIEYIIANKFIKNFNLCMRVNPDTPIVIHMKTCFPPTTKIDTSVGKKNIKDIRIGDLVLTHKNRYKKVTDIMSQKYYGDMIRIGFGRNGNAQTMTATPEHPILVERQGVKQWIKLENILINDVVFINSKKCSDTGEGIPYYATKKKATRIFKKGSKSASEKHLLNDIIPFCETKKQEGWIMIPVGGNVIPDAIGIKDNKIVAFEIEKTAYQDYPKFQFKQLKYKDNVINNYIDDVEWIVKGDIPKRSNSHWYEMDENGFCKVKILSIKRYSPKNNGRSVYNLTVEDDNTYVASNVVVHNCGGFWEEGMAIYDTIRSCPWPVTILNYTHARSMSSIIFQAANKRIMMPNSSFMFHDGTFGIEGTVKQVKSAVRFGDVADKTMLEIYAKMMNEQGEFKGKGTDKIKIWLRKEMDKKEDVYLIAEDAVKYGLADEVFDYNWSNLTVYTEKQLER
jgi:ATP-dependent protease ClpP protease subunit